MLPDAGMRMVGGAVVPCACMHACICWGGLWHRGGQAVVSYACMHMVGWGCGTEGGRLWYYMHAYVWWGGLWHRGGQAMVPYACMHLVG